MSRKPSKMKAATRDALLEMAIRVNYMVYCSLESDAGRKPLDKDAWMERVATGEIAAGTMEVR